MPKYSRTQLITTLSMVLNTIQDDTNKELNKLIAVSMFEVILRYYDLFTGKNDKRLIHTCYDKAKQGVENDLRFAKYVHKFEELARPPPLRRSARLLKRKPLILDNVQKSV